MLVPSWVVMAVSHSRNESSSGTHSSVFAYRSSSSERTVSDCGSGPQSSLPPTSSLVKPCRSPNSRGRFPDRPLLLRTSSDTRPIASVSTPNQSLNRPSPSQPSELVQFSPSVVSYRIRRAAISTSLHNGPAKLRSPADQLTNSSVAGTQRPSLPANSKNCRGRSRKPVGTMPVSALLPIHRPFRLSRDANSVGSVPVS